MIVAAPASRAPAMAASPTPPQPNTATESPAADLAGEHRGAEAGHDAAAEQAGGLGLRRLGAPWCPGPAATRVFSAKAPMPSAGRQRHAVEGHLLGGVVGGEAVPGPAPPARPALAAHGPPVEDHEVARRDVGDVGADRLDHAGRLVAEQEREVVVDGALAVVQVGVAHPARLHRRPAPRPGRGRAPRWSRPTPARLPPSPPPLGPGAPPGTPSSRSAADRTGRRLATTGAAREPVPAGPCVHRRGEGPALPGRWVSR